MRSVTAKFLDVVRSSHRAAARAHIVTTLGQTGTSPDGDEIPVMSGDVIYDAGADITATLDLTTDGRGWDPRYGHHSIQPYGNEMFVERGVAVGETIEWVSQGYYRIYSVDQEDAPDGVLRIAGRDRMSGIVDAKLTAPVQFSAADTVQDVFDVLVRAVYPAAMVEFDFNAAQAQLGRSTVAGADDSDDGAPDSRYGFLKDLADSRGKIMYFDYRGVLVVKSPPAVTAPLFTVDAGPGGVLVQARRSLDRDGVYNAVVATADGANSDAPPRAVAYDDNPNSPTYWRGRFGQVPRAYSSPLLTTKGQAAMAARTLLMTSTGLPYEVNFSAVPNPALEVYDPVRVVYGAGQPRETHVIKTLTIPMTTDAITATTREQGSARIATAEDGANDED